MRVNSCKKENDEEETTEKEHKQPEADGGKNQEGDNQNDETEIMLIKALLHYKHVLVSKAYRAIKAHEVGFPQLHDSHLKSKVIKALNFNIAEQQGDFGFLHDPVIVKRAFESLRDYRMQRALKMH